MLSFYIARRLRLGRRDGQRSIAVSISIVAVAVATVIMILTVAITAGFDEHIKGVISDFDGQMTVTAADMVNDDGIVVTDRMLTGDDTDYITSVVKSVAPEADVMRVLSTPAMLKTPDDFEAIILRAYGDYNLPQFIASMTDDRGVVLTDSLANAGEDYVVLSSVTARRLSLTPGDRVNIVFFEDGNIRLRNPIVSAIYNSNFETYDRTTAYVAPSMVREISGLSTDQCGTIQVSRLKFEDIGAIAREVNRRLWQDFVMGTIAHPFQVITMLEGSAQYIGWLELLDMNVAVIIVLIGLIATFTLMATLFILMLERTRTIGVLKAMGCNNMTVRKVFIVMIGRIVLRGLFWGNIIALVIVVAQSLWHLIPLDAETYFVSYVPVRLTVASWIIINVGALISAVTAMVVPSAVIGRMSPARALRYE